MKIRPAKLTQGDTVGVIALSSPLKMEQLPIKLELLERLGLRYKLGRTIAEFDGFLAGSDEERLADLHAMIADEEIQAIFCVRGGYGIGRLLDKIDYQLLQENPKIIWGFSDVTSLHVAVNQFADLVTFHGPMLSESSESLDELSAKMFQQLFTPMEIHYDEGISKLETIVGGVARGELIGGNLNRLVSTLATKFEADLQDKIVVLEDIHESPDRVDGMLNQLRLARKLEQVAGFVIGDFNGVEEAELLKIVSHYLKPLNKPVVAGFKIGHCRPNIGLPLGVEAILDADAKVLRILPGVE
ncbi:MULTISPECIES: LD-carboxypeptidase [Bacillales]|uniref:LD-carboxypeptidase n=1 Tax=Lysinibacillus louembei TaxID=1470088 RepID=A0ABZ0S2C7_9BACI|nr:MULTISPECIES: LD-carboxypeptidase [Bacillales]MCT6925787.1 LD-carboxypeptidase [Metasolibacillus sp.]MCT6941895.1 LD-carboxypeptidase [Metasolibacillus sp.]WPK13822.1 LD-carboxypeptidase [Lysinibacillus louembei]